MKIKAFNWFFLLLSLVCLYPGLTKPMMNLTISAALPILGRLELYNQTQSILQGVSSLFRSGNELVAILILLFSVIVPVIKALLLMTVITAPQWRYSKVIHQFVAVIGKWSMADVFVVGIFIAYLAGKANPNIDAELFAGFYWFTAYCIISLFATQCIRLQAKAVKK